MSEHLTTLHWDTVLHARARRMAPGPALPSKERQGQQRPLGHHLVEAEMDLEDEMENLRFNRSIIERLTS